MNSEATTQPPPIFVYGTLLPGQPNDYIWQDCAQAVERAFATGCCLYDFGSYPVMIEGGRGRVVGQLIYLNRACYSQTIQNLDFLEGFDPQHPGDSNFRRVMLKVTRPNGEKVAAWAYIGKREHMKNLPLIEHGDWAKFFAGKDNKIAGYWREFRTGLDD